MAKWDLPSSMHYANGCFRIIGAFSSHIRLRPYASIIYDDRCGMSVVSFHTAAPVGGISCYYSCYRTVEDIGEKHTQGKFPRQAAGFELVTLAE